MTTTLKAPPARSPQSPPYEPTPAEIGAGRVVLYGTQWMARCLPVLTPGFTVADLTPRALCRVLVAETRKQRRAS